MKMNITGICILAIVTAVIALTLKNTVPQYALLITLSAGVILLLNLCTVLPEITETTKELIDLANVSSKHTEILLKSIGICFISQFSSDICKDAGEQALSGKVELAGKITILICALPLIQEVLHTASTLLGV